MKVFITGGTGLVGSAVVAELVAAGHTVTALSRSASSAERAEAAGATPLRGSLTDLEVLRAGAERADGVIHLAFGNDFSSPEAIARDVTEEAEALAALAGPLIGTGRPLVTVAGTPVAPGRASTEEDPLPTEGPVGGRSESVARVLALAPRGVRAAAVRLPRTVHHDGPVESVPEDAFGPLGPVFATDQPASGARTRAGLGWTPVRPGLLADLENLGG
ncbi:NAD-dependent epimerase/dehydratase family protein [Streptomyces albidoflavus]|uniref:NAD-dependent epimerase/dehydratase family protein n=1 Tax=Streptomyces albidoflavus TaxID=1886 RepID=UPI0008F51C09|nr:NAD-dependent epimerase/dehydratase family protein [Streptomyces albidoflavus]